jgi:hypothetical protein
VSLVSNFAVTSTAKQAISGLARCRAVAITLVSGTGSVYYQIVDHLPIPAQSTTTLTTGNGTLLAFQPNPAVISLQPNYAATYPTINPTSPASSDDSDGFDLYLISNGTATVNVQTIPI